MSEQKPVWQPRTTEQIAADLHNDLHVQVHQAAHAALNSYFRQHAVPRQPIVPQSIAPVLQVAELKLIETPPEEHLSVTVAA